MIISWLLTRLWLGIEFSRLAIFRLQSRAIISRIATSQLEGRICIWVFDRANLYTVTLNDHHKQMSITQFKLETN